MSKEKYIQNLLTFIRKGTCSYTVSKYIKEELEKLGYQELFEENIWHLTKGNYFVIRNDASIIAFQIGQEYQNRFNIITTHSDTPSFTIKPQNELVENGYVKINVAPYGGLLNYGWLDRPLSIAGRVIIQKKQQLERKIIDFQKPMLTIPSVAIHQNDKANSNLDLNTQIDLIPIFSLTKEKDIIKNSISEQFALPKDTILDYDLHLYHTDEGVRIGKKKDLLLSPRIDNLTSVFAALEALKAGENNHNINVFCAFNSEEIGSLTKEGADSNFLLDTLKRIAASLNIDIATTLHNSMIINSDNMHAVHPNHPEKADVSNKIFLNQGVVIAKEINSTTDSLSSSLFKILCQKEKIPYQDFTSRNDLASGSTLAGINLRHVSTLSLDIGLAQLAMHSSMEVVGVEDVYFLYQVLNRFYNTIFIRKEKSTKIIFLI